MQQNKEYAEIGQRLINTLSELNDIKDVSIVYLSSEQQKKRNGKIIYGQCVKVANNYKWCCPADFMVIIYDQNIAGFNDKQIETLIRHELHHIGVRQTTKGESYYIVPHDVEEFEEILKDCGYDWSVV